MAVYEPAPMGESLKAKRPEVDTFEALNEVYMSRIADGEPPVKRVAPKLAEIAARIDAHLRRFEADPGINPVLPLLHRRFWEPRARATGRYVAVYYVGHERPWTVTKDDALAYLAWLDAGNVGKHFEMPREAAR